MIRTWPRVFTRDTSERESLKAEILSIGRELLMGETQDTNATFLAKELRLLGIELVWVSQVGDIQSQIVEVLRRAWGRSDVVLTTGGLGPTGDDLTREAIAEMLGESMVIDHSLEEWLRDRFSRFGMHSMPESNLKQCALIPSAKAIPNDQGTAPGWWVERDGRILACMPGPPRELYNMWDKEVRSRLRSRSPFVILAKTWKTFGYSEAAIGELAFPLFTTDNPSLGVYAKPDGIQLQLRATATTEGEAKEILKLGEAKILGVLGKDIWGTDEDTLESVVGELLVKQGLSVAVMEDYTAGLVISSLAETDSDHSFFKGGMVVRDNDSLACLGVSKRLVGVDGGDSQALAVAMAQSVMDSFRSDVGVGVARIETQQQNPVVCFAFRGQLKHVTLARPRDRQRLKTSILFELRRLLLERAAKTSV
jgi:nicotinamide-nucleotide amidase